MFDVEQVTSGEEVKENEREIIEFPWAVLDVESKQVVHDQRILVRITFYPSEICTAFSLGFLRYALERYALGFRFLCVNTHHL